MKRFYKEVAVRADDGASSVLLDGRPVRSPARQALKIPSRPVAEAVAEEWRAQGEEIEPAAMPMLRLVNTATDIVGRDREVVIDNLAGYGGTDLVCYFADRPDDLRQRQETLWRPVLQWAREALSADLRTVVGVGFIQQDEAVLTTLRQAVAAHDDMSLAALNDLVSISGSLLLALAHSRDHLDIEALWRAARVDEDFQAERWGWDAEAASQAEWRRQELEQAARFLRLHRQGLRGGE